MIKLVGRFTCTVILQARNFLTFFIASLVNHFQVLVIEFSSGSCSFASVSSSSCTTITGRCTKNDDIGENQKEKDKECDNFESTGMNSASPAEVLAQLVRPI